MEDREVVEAFVNQGATRAFSANLHIETDCLFIEGWWQAGFRIADDTFILRNEDPPGDTTLLDDLAAALSAKGLSLVGEDLPAVTMITYTQFTLGSASWHVWGTDLASAEATLAAKVTHETFFEASDLAPDTGDDGEDSLLVSASPELGGARRLAGLPPALVMAVGMGDEPAAALEAALGDCRVKTVSLSDGLDACSSAIPTLILVDATDQPGREFIMELRTAACGRFIPVAALTDGLEVPLGAEAVLDPRAEPASWVPTLRHLLP